MDSYHKELFSSMKPVYTLVIAALVIALIWRIEVEVRGWHGLTWVSYFHLAIPIGAAIFLGWTWMASGSNKRSLKIVYIAGIWGIIAYHVLAYAAVAYFAGGPSAAAFLMTFGPIFYHIHWLSPLVWAASILPLYVGYHYFFRFPIGIWFAGPALWSASWFLGLIVISIIPERGHPDLIHALKTGWMIPFCVIAVGLPILVMKPKNPTDPHS